MSDIYKLNQLTKQIEGIYKLDNKENDFHYTDGVDSEIMLENVLNNVTDLSSNSDELEEKIIDWPSEYHLSNKRANLLRGLNLGQEWNVLELGCGCGAITRYLGEQCKNVDAIEGSEKRAQLAVLRCQDLTNINIICADFNRLELPDDTYDVVFLVGVLEYAKRYWGESGSEEDAVKVAVKKTRS